MPRYRFLQSALAALCLWLGHLNAAEPPPVSEDFLLRVWEVDEGLPVNAVQAMVQTADGYLWLATDSGVVRFDGVRFNNFTQASGLESNRVHALYVRRSGELWVGLERGGVARLRAGRFETVMPLAASESKTGFVTSFAEDAEGAVWMGLAGEKRVVRWMDGAVTTFGPGEGVGPGEETYVHVDSAGRIWLATKGGCGIFDGKRFRAVDPEERGQAKLAPARAGGVWAANGLRLMRYQSDGSIEAVADLAWLGGSVEVRVLCEDESGALWIGSRGAGLYRFRDGQFVRVPTSHDALQALAQTSEGNLWAGTRGGGLNRLRPRQIFLRTTQHGLSKDSVAAITLDAAGALWIAPGEGEPVRALSAENDSFAVMPGWTEGAPVMVCEADREGNVWFGRNGSGVIRWRAGTFERIGTHSRIEVLLPARDGALWVARREQPLMRWKDGVEQELSGIPERSSVRALGEDEAGRIWAGTTDGLVFRRDADGHFAAVPLGTAWSGEGIRFFLPDGPETMWIGTEGGLLRWRNGKVARLTTTEGLPENDVRQMIFDQFDHAWIGTDRNLCRIRRSDLEAVLDGRAGSLQPAIFRRHDGLPNLGFTSGNRHASERTPDGHLWMATDRGALEIVPQPERPARPLPAVIIEEMHVAGEPVLLSGTMPKLPPRSRHFEIRYTVPRFTAPERMQFRYRLVGFDSDWTNAGDSRLATFTRLPPGAYHFEVAARELPGNWTAAATLSFAVEPAWSETLWFRVGAAVLGAGVVAWLVRLIVLRRVRARMRWLEQETALERERARIARDMHDELGASLTRIALMSDLAAFEPEGDGTAGKRFSEISRAARSVSGTLDQIVWTVNPRNDTVERLVGYLAEFATEYLESAGIPLSLELPSQVPATPVSSEVRHQVLLAMKEALNNVLKYAEADEVTVRVTCERGELGIVIVDNGRGFEPAVVSPYSNGLRNMQQRFATIGGSVQIDSRRGTGTSVAFRVPLG